MYCYLKARFGDPNGFQTFLAADHSDNWIHWDYNLKAGNVNLVISGMSREIHFLISEKLTDIDWKALILAIKADFRRVGKEKIAILKSLEKWVIFPNKFVEVARTCSYKHSYIIDYLMDKPRYSSFKANRKGHHEAYSQKMSAANKMRADMAQNALELSLLTPVMAEAFINMVILILCKKNIRDNARQFEAFIRSNLDVKGF